MNRGEMQALDRPDTLVLDAGALLEEGQAALPGVLASLGYDKNDDGQVEVATVKEVLAEVVDEKSRASLLSPASAAVGLLSSLRVLEPDAEALSAATRFARATGDLHFLSDADLKVIALAVTFKVQASGWKSVRRQPAPLVVASKNSSDGMGMPGWGTVSNPEEWAVLDELDDGGGKDDIARPKKERSSPGDSDERQGFPSKSSASEDIARGKEGNDVNEEDDGWFKPVSRSIRKRRARREKRDMIMQEAERLETLKIEREKKNNWEEATGSDGDRDEEQSSYHGQDPRSSTEQGPLSRTPPIIHSAGGKIVDNGAHPASVEVPEQGSDETSRIDSIQCDSKPLRGDPGLGSWASVLRGTPSKNSASNSADKGPEKIPAMATHEPPAPPRQESGYDFVSSSGLPKATAETDHFEQKGNGAERRIYCITGDFAVQNVLIQMGIPIVSPTGKHIDSVRRFVFICFACNHIMLQVRTKFCDRCGNDTLQRASLEADENEMRVFGKKKKYNLRGLRYSIPAPKSGRNDKHRQPVLSADEWLLRKQTLHSRGRANRRASDQVFRLDDCNSDNWHRKVNTATRGDSLEPSQNSAVLNFMSQQGRNPNERWCHRKRR